MADQSLGQTRVGGRVASCCVNLRHTTLDEAMLDCFHGREVGRSEDDVWRDRRHCRVDVSACDSCHPSSKRELQRMPKKWTGSNEMMTTAKDTDA